MGDTRGLHLRCRHGQFGWGALDIVPVGYQRYSVTAKCDLGDHFLQPSPDGTDWTIGAQPYVFPTRMDAAMALYQWTAQEE